MSRKYLIVVLLPVALLAAGCSVFGSPLTPNAAAQSRQDFASVDRLILAAAKTENPEAVLKAVIGPIRVETVQRPLLAADGSVQIGPDGKVLYTTSTTSEYGLPIAPTRMTEAYSEEFVGSSLSASSHTSSGGTKRMLTRDTVVDTTSYTEGIRNQTLQQGQGFEMLGRGIDALAALGGRYVDVKRTEAEGDTLVRLIDRGVLPPGYSLIPKEEEAHEEPEPAEPAAPPAAPPTE